MNPLSSTPGIDNRPAHAFPAALVAALREARHVVLLSGAGVSAESGVPTFRDAMTGLWSRFDPAELATPEAFERDPELVWGWYEWRRMRALQAQPNPAHLAIAGMSDHLPQLTLVTQNVDDLHERAGSDTVIHLHGSLHQPRCATCGRSHAFPDEMPNEPEGGRRLPPPRCTRCRGLIRPGVVWFGESLPEGAFYQAQEAAENCDLLISVGTSSLVYPAAGLPHLAKAHGSLLVQINPQPTNLDGHATWNVTGAAGQILPALVAAAWGSTRAQYHPGGLPACADDSR